MDELVIVPGELNMDLGDSGELAGLLSDAKKSVKGVVGIALFRPRDGTSSRDITREDLAKLKKVFENKELEDNKADTRFRILVVAASDGLVVYHRKHLEKYIKSSRLKWKTLRKIPRQAFNWPIEGK